MKEKIQRFGNMLLLRRVFKGMRSMLDSDSNSLPEIKSVPAVRVLLHLAFGRWFTACYDTDLTELAQSCNLAIRLKNAGRLQAALDALRRHAIQRSFDCLIAFGILVKEYRFTTVKRKLLTVLRAWHAASREQSEAERQVSLRFRLKYLKVHAFEGLKSATSKVSRILRTADGVASMKRLSFVWCKWCALVARGRANIEASDTFRKRQLSNLALACFKGWQRNTILRFRDRAAFSTLQATFMLRTLRRWVSAKYNSSKVSGFLVRMGELTLRRVLRTMVTLAVESKDRSERVSRHILKSRLRNVFNVMRIDRHKQQQVQRAIQSFMISARRNHLRRIIQSWHRLHGIQYHNSALLEEIVARLQERKTHRVLILCLRKWYELFEQNQMKMNNFFNGRRQIMQTQVLQAFRSAVSESNAFQVMVKKHAVAKLMQTCLRAWKLRATISGIRSVTQKMVTTQMQKNLLEKTLRGWRQVHLSIRDEKYRNTAAIKHRTNYLKREVIRLLFLHQKANNIVFEMSNLVQTQIASIRKKEFLRKLQSGSKRSKAQKVGNDRAIAFHVNSLLTKAATGLLLRCRDRAKKKLAKKHYSFRKMRQTLREWRSGIRILYFNRKIALMKTPSAKSSPINDENLRPFVSPVVHQMKEIRSAMQQGLEVKTPKTLR